MIKFRASWLLLLLLLLSCRSETGTVLQIRHAIAPSLTCVFAADAVNTLPTGFYDPMGFTEFHLVLGLVNHLPATDEFESTGPDKGSITPASNNIVVTGFEGCFYREADPNLKVKVPGNQGRTIVNCSDLPENQQIFYPSSSSVEPDEGKGLASLSLLGTEELGILYPGLRLDLFPEGTVRGIDGDGDGSFTGPLDEIRFAPGPGSPVNTNTYTRSTYWGAYPESRKDTVIYQLKALGKLVSGKIVHSNEFAYPIEICVGCVIRQCGELRQSQCTKACGGTSPCPISAGSTTTDAIQRSCVVTNSSACELGTCVDPVGQRCNIYAFVGKEPSVNRVCLPYQITGFMIPCVPFDGCAQ